jgi:hypothetical protein
MEGDIKEDRNPGRWVDGVNSDSLALGVSDWTHCGDMESSTLTGLNQVLVVV